MKPPLPVKPAPPIPAAPPPIAVAPPPLSAPPIVVEEDSVDPFASTADATAEPSPESSGSRRSYERFPVEVSVDFVSEHNFFTGFSLNVSEGGLFVATHVARPVGSRLEIRLALPDSPEPLEILTEVRWVREHSDTSDASPGLGLRFVGLSKEDEARIHAFVQRVRDPLFYDDD